MTFEEKLSFLLKTFNSNNSKLAKAINVDPSLISKWRNGRRTLDTDSPYVELIAEYFLNIDLLQQQKNLLANMLMQYHSGINMPSRIQIKKLLIEWIFSAERNNKKNEMNQYRVNNYKNYDVNNFIANFNNLTAGFLYSNSQNIQINTEIPIKRGESGYYEVFRGKEGKRQALLNAMSMMLSSDKPLELLLCDETSLDWLIEDQIAFMKFGKLLNQLISQGHKIIIIHNVNRESSQIMAIMDFWLPLYLTGYVESYFSPKSINGTNCKALFIVRDTAAVLSMNLESSNENACVFITKEKLLVQLAEELFMSCLAKAHTLVRIYKNDNIDALYNEVNAMEEKNNSIYTLRNKLSLISMPVEIYSKLLDNLNLTEQARNERLEFHARSIENFKNRIKYYKHTEIINMDAFEKFSPEGFFRYDGLDFFATQAVKCEPEDFIAHITNLIQFLKEYDNYKVVLVKFNNIINQNRVSITVKADCTAIVSSSDINGNNPIIIATDQDHIVEGIKQYLVNLIDNIPSTKLCKGSVIKRFEEDVAVLRKWNSDMS